MKNALAHVRGRLRNVNSWAGSGRLRRRARRTTIIVIALIGIEFTMATVLGRLGVVDQLLSPSGQGAQLLAGLAAAGLLTLRLILIFAAAPVLVYQWVRAFLVTGEPTSER